MNRCGFLLNVLGSHCYNIHCNFVSFLCFTQKIYFFFCAFVRISHTLGVSSLVQVSAV